MPDQKGSESRTSLFQRPVFRSLYAGLKAVLKKFLPEKVQEFLLLKQYAWFGRPVTHRETFKARERRQREGFFTKYCQGHGLDIGYGGDKIMPGCKTWDTENGDATFLKGLKNERFDFVYSSHTLEHLVDPDLGLRNWWRVLKPEGFLILYVPHRDLYEKRATLPSRWNDDHKHFFLLDRDERPDTLGLLPLIYHALPLGKIIYARECREGHSITDPTIHSDGEYSIEVVIQKIRG